MRPEEAQEEAARGEAIPEQQAQPADTGPNKEPIERLQEEARSLREEAESLRQEAESLRTELARLQEEKEAASRQLLRMQADFDNYRRRTRQEGQQAAAAATAEAVLRFLPAIDNLERALAAAPSAAAGEGGQAVEALVDGVGMVLGQMNSALASLGVSPVEAEGRPFDPKFHEAFERKEVEDPSLDGQVLEVLQRGYVLGDRLLRPSLVRVAVHVPPQGEPPGDRGDAAEGPAGDSTGDLRDASARTGVGEQ